MSKKSLNETEICDLYITPAIRDAGWDNLTQIRREYTFTDGKVKVRGKVAVRGEKRRADYLLLWQANLPLAVVEAKDNKHSVGDGLPQALRYAEALDVPFVFASNGDAFLFHDRTGRSSPVEITLRMDQFPSPAELWERFRAWRGLTENTERIARTPYHDDGSGREPRYYQRIAIQRTVEAVGCGDRRILLVMATGTGKTYAAFQIIWRLWKAGRVKRVLFLVDRNILADQTLTNDFKPFGSVMTKVQDRMADKSYEVYLALYQAVTGSEEEKQVYQQFSRDFFDLVVVDECHRGSANEQSAWREILDWFEPAVQLGLTATPKETADVSTFTYFGEPIYTYSLRQGIEDGFLAPYKVVRIDFDRDLIGWRPTRGQRDDHGRMIEDRTYNQPDMDRTLVLHQRTRLVAEKVVDYLQGTDPYGKTIIFCEDVEHAERMRSALVNVVSSTMTGRGEDLGKYIVRITGEEQEYLYDFLHPERRFPVIATTSKLLSTGVDAKTCKLIVIDQRITSMSEFKQIIGRGTRIHEEAGKLWFTIMDFKKATELFADPDFDGPPVVVYAPGPHDSPVPPDPPEGPDDLPRGPRPKFYLTDEQVGVALERTQYIDGHGRLITESVRDHARSTVRQNYRSIDDFLRRWSEAERGAIVVEELREVGVLFEELREVVGRDLDPFDLVCHVVYDRPARTRRERADQVRKRNVYERFAPQARAVLDALLDKYADEGVVPADLAVLRVRPISDLGTAVELARHFGGNEGFLAAVREIEAELYRDAG